MNQHETHITAPDDSDKVVREAIPPSGQPKVVIPSLPDVAPGVPPPGRPTAAHRGKLYGMSLAWRGLRLLGVAFGIVAVWFVAAWLRHGRSPLGLFPSSIQLGIGSPPSPILPPVWLLAVTGFLVLVSICIILIGTQDNVSKMKFKKYG